MHAQRFVNLAPLSLLANTMGSWFKDVRTHPPIVFRFPPPRELPDDSPTPMDGRSLVHSGEPVVHHNTIVSIQDLLLGTTPYASLDDARFAAFSPAWKASLNFGDAHGQTLLEEGGEAPASPRSVQSSSTVTATSPTQYTVPLGTFTPRLPNSTLEIDLRTLNLHLTLRVKEIIACAEAMWDWVVEYQAKTTREPKEGVYAVISQLTRAEFDDLLVRFEL
ncbi:hypothetical protein HYDPIDRAFT_175509 [Hydnomerulius pinastri MD-312]|uniref:Uncharacterized protein n=1 Tax=Hydnomerulius pinastri MD-312 TaxID=994086 RepID=A0A0C9W9R4_9AGAM|nr:hypothetical protein HYDPIDRAFT_175509 [Hydnomerulius pinastri MD-312]